MLWNLFTCNLSLVEVEVLQDLKSFGVKATHAWLLRYYIFTTVCAINLQQILVIEYYYSITYSKHELFMKFSVNATSILTDTTVNLMMSTDTFT